MPAFETLLRANIEPITYVVFFGLLAVLAVLECFIEMRRSGARRSRRWPTNFALTTLNIIVLSAIPITALAAADLAHKSQVGLFNLFDVPFAVVLIAGFLLRSLVSWVLHYAFHNIRILWNVHRVHHTDTHVDVSTTVRMHPLEFVISAPIIIATIVIFGLPAVVVMLYELFDAAIAVFSHANIKLPKWLDRALVKVIITPNIHRIHHSPHVPETNSNYGATLTLWDRVFGTLQQKTEPELAHQQLGLSETQDDRAHSFWFMMTLPFRPYRLRPINRPAESHDKVKQGQSAQT